MIQRVRPDLLLLNEFDQCWPGIEGLTAFNRDFLGHSQGGAEPIHYEYLHVAPSNTGVPVEGESDLCQGFGQFPGHYGMALLSRYPLDLPACRSFRLFPWSAMPGASRPMLEGRPYHEDILWQKLRLSSKSHWDLAIDIQGKRLRLLASHPTPPVFDGPERRNAARNFDEIRFWADYLSPERSQYIRDDQGRGGGLEPGLPFLVLGDLNADPAKGESLPGAAAQLLNHPLIDSRFVPSSPGGLALGDAGRTADWGLRVDYVLPSRQGLEVKGGGVFWPAPEDPQARLVRGPEASDHRLVWLDIELL
ncbi:endonuclease/exonuclease/phosphatase family protein [Gallaecimonas kandeliae]|uniref:endonuclease/exonuclease/phosphatase family protein n=1 Tax=Gallaecimonas kandeliae TaxID=3029055 RepID=UPI002648EA96|nr:endonuclease/exonuclease/phosphatase family protein [Gallaecimonas kandeliae]WKE64883.1 endonuclease/exonuclease/phosphatase family protein [Gallaecimonas kandeliae]